MPNNDFKKYDFSLNHFVLYSKGWYRPVEREIDVFKVYKRVLELDGYSFIENMNDVVMIVMVEFTSFNDFCKENKRFNYSILTFFERVHQSIVFYNLDYQVAIVETIKSFFREAEGSYINLKPPFYDRKLYKKGLMFNSLFSFPKIGQTYKEQNKIANSVFK